MFYFFLALTAILAATTNADGPVFDTDGHLISNGSYYVLPFVSGTEGGGLTLVPNGGKCSLSIGQESSEVKKGIPVKFSNWKSRVGFVLESENLNIEMDVKSTICVQSTYWWVDAMIFHIEAGPKPKPGEASTKSFFQIRTLGGFNNGYYIMFCPDVYSCMSVGVGKDIDGVRRLFLGPRLFPVRFVKATGTETSSKSISII